MISNVGTVFVVRGLLHERTQALIIFQPYHVTQRLVGGTYSVESKTISRL